MLTNQSNKLVWAAIVFSILLLLGNVFPFIDVIRSGRSGSSGSISGFTHLSGIVGIFSSLDDADFRWNMSRVAFLFGNLGVIVLALKVYFQKIVDLKLSICIIILLLISYFGISASRIWSYQVDVVPGIGFYWMIVFSILMVILGILQTLISSSGKSSEENSE